VCRPKHVEQLRNIGIINSTTRLHLVGSFYEISLGIIRIVKFFSTFFFDFRENVKIIFLNMIFAQRHIADLAVLVIFLIRMFHYCSLLPDFDKIWYWSSIIKLECDVVRHKYTGSRFLLSVGKYVPQCRMLQILVFTTLINLNS
jgi:hypothetical protein